MRGSRNRRSLYCHLVTINEGRPGSCAMDADVRKTTLRMIPYGLYVLTAVTDDSVGCGTINWVSHMSFEPPLLALGVKTDSGASQHLKNNGAFALSIRGTGQKDTAFAFFKPTEQEGDKLNGYRFETPVLTLQECGVFYGG